MNQGIALLNLGRIDPARQFLEQAVKQNPSNPYAWYNLGMLEKNSANAQAAVDAFRRVTGIDPNDADTWYFLGASYAQNKQYPEAIDAFQSALKLNPLHASAEFGLSRAYQQSADLTHAREHLTRFQYITQNKLGSPISLAYGEQGKYSLAEESPSGPVKVLPAIDVRFVDATDKAGLKTKSSTAKDVASYAGPGACFLDYDNDGRIDIFLPDNGKEGGMSLYHNLGNGKFEEVTKKAGLDPKSHATNCTAGDYDNDSFTDLAVTLNGRVILLHNEKNGTFKNVTDAAGINIERFDAGLTFIDYDHDGDLDLFVTGTPEKPGTAASRKLTGANVMLRNNGNGTFTDVTESVGLEGDTPNHSSVGTDYNNDRAVDIVVTGMGGGTPSQGSPGTLIYENPREGKFIKRPLWSSPIASETSGVAALDFNHDGWMDIAFGQSGTPALTLWRNNQGKSFESIALPITNWVRGFGVAAIDYDNDGWVDLSLSLKLLMAVAKSVCSVILGPTVSKMLPPTSASTKFSSKTHAPLSVAITTMMALPICSSPRITVRLSCCGTKEATRTTGFASLLKD